MEELCVSAMDSASKKRTCSGIADRDTDCPSKFIFIDINSGSSDAKTQQNFAQNDDNVEGVNVASVTDVSQSDHTEMGETNASSGHYALHHHVSDVTDNLGDGRSRTVTVSEKEKSSALANIIENTGNLVLDETSGSSSSPDLVQLENDKDEIEKALEKVKKRRSTLGRSRKSLQSQKAVSNSAPLLTLEDQVKMICQDRSGSISKQLLDVSYREALRRMHTKSCSDASSDMALKLLRDSDSLVETIDKSISLEDTLHFELVNRSQKMTAIKETQDHKRSLIAAYQEHTKQLEDESRTWRSMMKERKLNCKDAEREYRDAKKGEIKIEEVQQYKHLSVTHRTFLASHPDYNRYAEEVQSSIEEAAVMADEIGRMGAVLKGIGTFYKAEADRCYFVVEEKSFGDLKRRSFTSDLKTLLTWDLIPEA